MVVSAQFHDYVLDQLRAVRPVTARRMFGGVGFYADALFFALADDDTLYFKVDAANRPDYEAAGMRPFQPFGERSTPMAYFELPARVLEDEEELARWMNKALNAARHSKSERKPRRKQEK